jgi:hypothetical protein
LKIKKTCIKARIFNYMLEKHPYYTSVKAGVTYRDTRKGAETCENTYLLIVYLFLIISNNCFLHLKNLESLAFLSDYNLNSFI